MVEGVAGTIPFIESEGLLAIHGYIHIRVIALVLAKHGFGFLVKDDIGELFVLVGTDVQGFLHQFPIDMRSVLLFVVPTVDPVYPGAGAVLHFDPLLKSGCRVSIGAGLRLLCGLKLRQTEIHADADELFLGDQDVCQRVVEEFSDDSTGVLRDHHEIFHALH